MPSPSRTPEKFFPRIAHLLSQCLIDSDNCEDFSENFDDEVTKVVNPGKGE
jgi:hypothetical protein